MTEIKDNFLIKDDSSIALNTPYDDNSQAVYSQFDHYYAPSASAGAIYGKRELHSEVEETPILMPAEESRPEEEERAVARAYEAAAARSIAISKIQSESEMAAKDERFREGDQAMHNNYIQSTWKRMLTEEQLKMKIPLLMTVTDPYDKNIDASTSNTATETMTKNDPLTMYDQLSIPEQDASRPIVAGKGVNNYEQFSLQTLSKEMAQPVHAEVVDAMTDHGIRTAYGHLAEKTERKPFDDVAQMKQSMFMVNKMGLAAGAAKFTSTQLVGPEGRQLVEY